MRKSVHDQILELERQDRDAQLTRAYNRRVESAQNELRKFADHLGREFGSGHPAVTLIEEAIMKLGEH